MSKKYKGFIFLLLLFITCSVSILPASADGPGPPAGFHVSITNLPENAAFADLLIPIGLNDPNYAKMNRKALTSNKLSATAQIVTYAEAGYRSYTFHYKDSFSAINLNGSGVSFCYGVNLDGSLQTQLGAIRSSYKTAKIALLDKSGNIVLVSPAFTIADPKGFRNMTGEISYDASANVAKMVTEVSDSSIAIFVVMIIVYIITTLFTIMIEVLIGFIFRFRGKQIGIIILVNLISQVIMHLLFVVIPLSYWTMVFITEPLIYLGEFIAYKYLLKDVPTKRILFYVIVANTASLVFGLFAAGVFYQIAKAFI